MNTEHREILEALKIIPEIFKDYSALESSKGDSSARKKLSVEEYQLKIIDFDSRNHRGLGLRGRIFSAGKKLDDAKPDFTLSYQDKERLHEYIKTVGEKNVSERIKKQFELLELIGMQNQFKTTFDILDETKVKELTKYLKGKI